MFFERVIVCILKSAYLGHYELLGKLSLCMILPHNNVRPRCSPPPASTGQRVSVVSQLHQAEGNLPFWATSVPVSANSYIMEGLEY